jgi:hypothetical protein
MQQRVAGRVQLHLQEILNVAVGALEIVGAKAEAAVNLLASLWRQLWKSRVRGIGERGSKEEGAVGGWDEGGSRDKQTCE